MDAPAGLFRQCGELKWPLFFRTLESSVWMKKKNVYIKLAEAVSMRCEEKLRGRSEYPITNTDMVHPP